MQEQQAEGKQRADNLLRSVAELKKLTLAQLTIVCTAYEARYQAPKRNVIEMLQRKNVAVLPPARAQLPQPSAPRGESQYDRQARIERLVGPTYYPGLPGFSNSSRAAHTVALIISPRCHPLVMKDLSP